MTKYGTDVWDRAYTDGLYLQYWESREPGAELVTVVAAGVVAAGATALDVGCGAGQEAVFLATCGLRVIGVDPSREALAIAHRRATAAGVEVEWRQGSAFSLPVRDAAIDLVIDRGCLHLFPVSERAGFAAEIARVLRPGGIYFVRGAREDRDDGSFAVGAADLDRFFPAPRFERGPVLPVTLHYSEAGEYPAHVALLRRR